jgi:hypothetical protein
MEQELPIFPNHLSSPLVFGGVRVTRSLVFCVVFKRSSFVPFFLSFFLLCASYLDIYLEIKDTTDTDMSASYLDLHIKIYSEGRTRTKLYDKRDDFNFLIVNFPFKYSNIPATPAYGVYISQFQLIRYSRACCSYQNFLDRVVLLTRKLLN